MRVIRDLNRLPLISLIGRKLVSTAYPTSMGLHHLLYGARLVRVFKPTKVVCDQVPGTHARQTDMRRTDDMVQDGSESVGMSV